MKYKPVDEKIFKKPSTSSVLTRMSIEPCERVAKKQHSRDVYRKRCSENIQQIYRRTPMQSNFFEIVLRHRCSPVQLLHILRTRFNKNTCGGLLLVVQSYSRLLVYVTIVSERPIQNSARHLRWTFNYFKLDCQFEQIFGACQCLSLREECPNTEFFLVYILPHSD